MDVEHQATDLVVGRESGGCDVELDHQGAMVADRGGGHPGPSGLDRPGWIVAQDMVQLLGGGGIGPGAAPPGLGPAPPGGQHQHCRGHVQVAHQQPRRRPGPGHHLQLPQLGDVVALAVGQVGGRHRYRARPHLEAGQDRGALFTATGRGEPQMLDGRPGGWGFESRAARTNPMGQRPRVVATRGIRVAATGCAASRA
jgi:hypothetical protein